MAKFSGIREKIMKKKKSKPVLTHRIAVHEKNETVTPGAPVDIQAVDKTEYLEETPAAGAVQFKGAKSASQGSAVRSRSKQAIGSLNMSRCSHSKKSSFFVKLRVLKETIFGKRTRESAALDFAMNNKHVSKRQRRRRMLMAYIGTGIVVAAVLLVVVFVPGGKAASDIQPSADSGMEVAAAGDLTTKNSDPSPTAQASSSETASPEPSSNLDGLMGMEVEAYGLTTGTLTEVPTEESAEAPAETPTEEPTEAPTEEPTEEPTPIPTTEPDPTPPPITVKDCIDYYIVDADKYYNDMGYSNNHYDYTENDVYMLAQIIQCEAGGESREGMVAVGNVVMNRVLNRHQFANTIQGVITAPGQFAYNSSRKPSSSAMRAARLVLQDEYWVLAQDVYYFRSGASAGVDWGSHRFYCKIGGHCFYTHSYSGRHRGGTEPPKLFDRTYKYAQYGCKPEKRVYRIQYMLNKLGYDVKADKYFGQDTVDALKKFQEDHGLKADGIAGPSTVTKLIEKFGLINYYKRFVA